MFGLSDLLDSAVRSHPDRTALSGPNGVFSYAGLDTAISNAAGNFRSQGVGREDVVAVVTDNRVEGVIALLALARLGAIPAPVAATTTDAERRTLLARLRPDSLLIAALENRSLEDPRVQQIRVDTTAPSSPAAPIDPAPHDTALLLFTAGSTGAPKIVPLTNRNVTSSVGDIASTYRLSPKDRTLLTMPLAHGHALIGGLLSTLASGGTVTLPRTGRFSAHTFIDELRAANATWYTATPTMHRLILMHAGEAKSPELRFVRSCSEALPQDLAAKLSNEFSAPVIPAYGMTETAHQATSNPLPEDGLIDLGSVGRPSSLTISIRGVDGRAVTAGHSGEIWVSGRTVTPGYLDDPEADAAAFVEEWYRTGDLGSVDARGYLTVTGRLDDVINRGGEKISPQEVEAALLGARDVVAAAAFGVPDATYGERVEAAIVTRPGSAIATDTIQEATARVLAPAAVPSAIHTVSELPLTAKGTVDRRRLATEFGKES